MILLYNWNPGIVDGHRTWGPGFTVASKREARQLAKQYGATPWNF
jgi:hypothetical protein